ncbi:2cddeab7-f117-426f-9689-20ca9a29a157 [Sclerotinia trifoliorum]|uniref:2cddeab7-f117-426f-9689-20ca9a29a157 n=1 Tax=Sclerotinia trifoliorum TaxID=28548 RepID=A0A8H2ZRX0_9HELO|nr:2cddeab7-f117-426f-9689-20ca9a29a157 [Sclerotinia trifoliorum]
MSENNYRINQHGNIGLSQAVNYGPNYYSVNDSTKVNLMSPRHFALQTHKKVKEEWEDLGTCGWLLQEPSFQSWLEMNAKHSLLWIYGRRGCGKSTLMSRVVESIYQDQFPKRGPDAIHLLYFYIEKDQQGDNFRSMLMTFWEQANNKPEELSINTFGKDCGVKKIQNELHSLLASSKRDIYIVIDALDQLSPHSQNQLIIWLNAMVQRLDEESGGRLSVAISSPDYPDMDQLRAHKLFRLFPIEVTPKHNNPDIKKYLEKNLQSKLFEDQPNLGKQVFDRLINGADGMFLWVHLQILNIRNMEMESQVVHALQSLIPPEGMQTIYQKYAQDFESLGDIIRRQISQRAIALLSQSTGSMPIKVVIEALSLDNNGRVEPILHRELTANPARIVSFCNYLLRINDNLGIFQFCHGTVFEFFKSYKPAIYNHRIAKICLSHLCSSEFSKGSRSDATWYSPGSLKPILQNHPFLQFASSEWATSIKKSSKSQSPEELKKSHSEVFELLETLFGRGRAAEKKGNLQLAFQVHLLNMDKEMPRGVSHDHIVSYFALVELFDFFKEKRWFDPKKPDSDGLMPIHWAIRNEKDFGDVVLTVEKLIDYGAEFDVTDNEGRSPLYYAAHCGNSQVTQLLIDRKAKLNLRDKNGETALIAACRKHHENDLTLLLNAGADVNIKSLFGTALHVISLIGCCGCAKKILFHCKKSKTVQKDGPFGTSLHAAAFYGHSDLVKVLCSQGINFRTTHETYGTPVTAAAAGLNPGLDPARFKETIQELIKYGVKVNDQGSAIGPALRVAAYHGSPEIVLLLLAEGAEVRKAKGPMGTAYEAAEDRGHREIQNILLKSDPNAAGYGGAHASQSRDPQQINRRAFRAAVKASSMDTINIHINQLIKFFEKEYKRGETKFLRALANLGKEAFQDVIILATESRDNNHTATKRQDHRGRLSLRGLLSSIFCTNFKSKDGGSVSGAKPSSETSSHPRRGSNFVQDGLGGHFPQVLDRMTQAAVKILENAIASENQAAIKLIANTWVETLNNLISYPGFGESMLNKVVQTRANELKGHLTNPDLGSNERFSKAEALALVGIELLLVAVERGKQFKYLSFVISKLWIKALDDVEELGEAGQMPILAFIRIFQKRFSVAVKTKHQANAEVCTKAGIELLRAASFSPSINLLEKLSNECVVLIILALQQDMAYMINTLINQRLEEYQEFLKDGKHVEAFSLALANIGVLRAAIEQRSGPTASILQLSVESAVECTRKFLTDPNKSTAEPALKQYLRAIVDGVISLIGIAEEVQPGRLRSLASNILDLAKFAFSNHYKELTEVVNQRIKNADQILFRPEREKRLIQIARTIYLFLDIALCTEERDTVILTILKRIASGGLIKMLPDFVQRGELVGYVRVIEFLNVNAV